MGSETSFQAIEMFEFVIFLDFVRENDVFSGLKNGIPGFFFITREIFVHFFYFSVIIVLHNIFQ